MPQKKHHRPKGPFDPMKQMRFDFEYAKWCITHDGHVLPVFVVHEANGMLPIGWGPGPYNDDGRELHRKVTQLACVAHDAFAVAYIGEAWIAESLPDEPEIEFPRVRPKDRKDRREIILAQMLWREGDSLLAAMTQAEIVRNAKGECTGLTGEETSEPTDIIMGNFAHLLSKDRPPREIQEAAEKALLELGKSGMLRQLDPPTLH